MHFLWYFVLTCNLNICYKFMIITELALNDERDFDRPGS